MRVTIVATNAANLASVRAGFERLGCEARVSGDAGEVRDALAVVLPGVGAFGPAIMRLRERGLADVLRKRIGADRPTLGICLGMQMMLDTSEESPGESGLGVASGCARRFSGGVRVPQMGWNRVRAIGNGWAWPRPEGDAYFANSYRLERGGEAAVGWSVMTGEYGGEFVAAMARGRVLACQFHPELSGAFGREMLDAWLGVARC